MKTKNILFRFNLEGRGIVNFDDAGVQKWLVNQGDKIKGMLPRNGSGKYTENITLGKKSFFMDDEGNLGYKLKISENSLRHAIFKDDVYLQSPSIMHNQPLLYSYIASPMGLLRGYSFMTKHNSGETLKKKSPVTITDAIQSNNAKSSVEVQVKSGEKTTQESADDAKDTSLFYKETAGDMEYNAKGVIDLMELQFVSGDKIFDRYAFNPDYYEMYSKLLAASVPGFDAKLGYYTISNSVQKLPEYGVLLSNENVVSLVREFFKRLLSTSIKRKGSFASVTNVQIKLVDNVINGGFTNNEGWVDLNLEGVEGLNFDTQMFYDEADFDEVKKLKTMMDEAKKASKEAGKKKKSK
jgi:hypothetical protein